jgi:PelA/Pel-15E family pectate lyase
MRLLAGVALLVWLLGPDAAAAVDVVVADNVLSYQLECGGWPKNTDMTRSPCPPEEKQKLERDRAATFDNGATHRQMRMMAAAYGELKHERFRESFLRGLDYILEAQYPNGGWPQRYPLRGGYSEHITFNDGAMIGLMEVLRDAAEFSFVDDERREKARRAYQRGIECILKCQIIVNGRRTVWCAQHDAKTLEPRPARSYEKESLSGAESTGIVLFLMKLEKPSPEVRRAINGACAWFERSKLTGIRQVSQDGDKVIVPDPDAPPLWARFYDIKTNRPIFCGRDGVIKYKLSEIEKERRTGYAWYGGWGAKVLDAWPEWRQRHSP